MGNEPVPEKKENETSNDANSKKECPEAPLPVAPAKPNLSSTKGHDCCKKYKRIKEEIKYWFELGGILAGLAVLYILVRQYQEMVKTTNVAIGQLGVMQGQLSEMQIDERAWVFIDIQNNSLSPDGTNFLLTATAKNAGKTVGLVTGTFEKIAIKTNDIPPQDPEITGLKIMLPPDKPITLPYSVNQLLITGSKYFPVYVFGTIFYEDISGKKHWTQFCYSITEGGFKVTAMSIHSSCDDLEKQQK